MAQIMFQMRFFLIAPRNDKHSYGNYPDDNPSHRDFDPLSCPLASSVTT